MTDVTQPAQARYKRLADGLIRQIEAGELAPGTALPPERSLAEMHGVSRVTVRRAIKHLGERGLIEQRRGAGTFVSQRVSQPLSVLTSFSEDLAARGMTGQSRVISSGRGRATPEEVIALGLGPNAPVTRITRLRSADGQPLAVEATTVLSEALANPRLISDSLYETMETCGMRPVRAVQRLTAVAIEPEMSRRLDVAPGAPGLLITRIGYTAADRAVELTRSTFRGDRWDFVTELS